MHNDLYIDLETCPDLTPGARQRFIDEVEAPGQYKKPESIAEWKANNAESVGAEQWQRTALDPMQGGIYVIGWSVAGGPVRTVSRDPRVDKDEGAWLNHALQSVMESCHEPGRPVVPRFVGWNVLNFDLPFLAKRCCILGIRPPMPLPMSSRYNGERVLDLMQAWAGVRDYAKQSTVAKAMGIGGGPDIDGSKLWDAVTAEFDGVTCAERKCAADVGQLVEIHRRMSEVYGLAASAA